MDTRKLIEVLRATIDPNQRIQAEEHLNQVHKIIGFAPSLLQVVMMTEVEMPVRQAGVIYLKNLINQFWSEREGEPGQPLPFCIHEQDRCMIRDAIVDAVVLAPDLIRVQLAVCVSTIVKHDFPGRWTGIVDKVSVYIQNPEMASWIGALLCLYQLVKNYEYKKPEERGPLNEAMHMLLPMIYQRCVQLLPDQTEYAVLLQKQILKIYFALIQYFLSLELVTKEIFSQWVALMVAILERPVPEQTNQIDEDERPDLAWWKCKKWALHILERVFERYGSPSSVVKEYNSFSEWYLKEFSGCILTVLLKVLDQYRQQMYVSPRVLQLTLNYLNQGVNHAFSWKFLKLHMQAVIQEVLFPLMCYTDADADLWESDPYEYIRMKFDIFEDFVSPVTAARTLLHTAAKKRKDVLPKTMAFVMTILNASNPNSKQKDGALHMVGTVADILLKKKMYQDQMEVMLVTHVFPEFNSSEGYMRARACWVLHHFSEVKFKNEQNLLQALTFTQNCLLNDQELPVKVEAAIALQMLISSQDKAQKHVETHVKAIALELLKIIRETENDDLTNVMQKLVCTYTEQLTPIAVEMTQHLATTFSQVLDSDEGSDDKAITAMGILNTIETILTVMEDQKEIINQLEGIVLHVIGLILSQSVMEFYEEALSLVYSLTCNSISADLWKIFEMIYQMFQKDGFDYFTDMMPALHNFITVDPNAFLSNDNHLVAVYNMSKAVLTSEAGEDPECHAAKLLEVMLLQYKGRIDQCVPSFVELALERLTREVKTSELRTMCLQVVIAALYYNPQFLFETLEKIHLPNSTDSITAQFIKQWLHDTDCFLGLHDRKMCVLGLCALMNTPPNRPGVINEVVQQMMPSLILLFEGLKRAYANRAHCEDDSDDEDEEYDPDVLDSDEDDIDDESQEYLERLQEKVQSAECPFPVSATIQDDDDGEEEHCAETEETALESYTTPLDDEDCPVDEYIVFKEILHHLQQTDPSWYNMLTGHLTPEQQKSVQDVFILAEQRKAAAESRRIDKSGGYVFQNQTVPASFNFGGSFS